MPLATAKSFTRAFLPCWLITYLLASLFHTQTVLLRLAGLNVEISLSERVITSLDDLVGLLPLYGSLIAAALFISLSVTGVITKKFSRWQVLVPVSTAFAMYVMLMLMEAILQFTFIAGARSVAGLFLQVLAGFSGGLLFLRLYRHRQQPPSGREH